MRSPRSMLGATQSLAALQHEVFYSRFISVQAASTLGLWRCKVVLANFVQESAIADAQHLRGTPSIPPGLFKSFADCVHLRGRTQTAQSAHQCGPSFGESLAQNSLWRCPHRCCIVLLVDVLFHLICGPFSQTRRFRTLVNAVGFKREQGLEDWGDRPIHPKLRWSA